MILRTSHARHVAVGNVEETKAAVDKPRTWGRTFSPEVIAAQLAGDDDRRTVDPRLGEVIAEIRGTPGDPVCGVCGDRYPEGAYRVHCRTPEHEAHLGPRAVALRERYHEKNGWKLRA